MPCLKTIKDHRWFFNKSSEENLAQGTNEKLQILGKTKQSWGAALKVLGTDKTDFLS